MNMQLQLILPTLIVPIALSFIVFKAGLITRHRRDSIREANLVVAAIMLAWLVSFIWIAGIPALVPREAIQWLPFLAAIFVALQFLVGNSRTLEVLAYLFIPLSIVVLTWSVISYKPGLTFFLEVAGLTVIGCTVIYRILRTSSASPGLTLGVSSMGLAVVSGLGGSLLIAQLAAALASVFTSFILFEVRSGIKDTRLKSATIILGVLMTLWLLLIGRVYAELPLISISLLLSSLLVGLTLKWRAASALSIILVIASIGWLLLNTDSSSYY